MCLPIVVAIGNQCFSGNENNRVFNQGLPTCSFFHFGPKILQKPRGIMGMRVRGHRNGPYRTTRASLTDATIFETLKIETKEEFQ
ncbi:hypothetical protein GTID1_02805 [Geobacillus thermodenitrificans]|nr:hypothetical protein GTID1_02805 [Geobacillus thermodenitrificans]